MVGEAPTAVAVVKVETFQSRCRDWVVGEASKTPKRRQKTVFQSRCRDWVVGEEHATAVKRIPWEVSVSLPRLGGWRAPVLRWP